MYELYVKNSRGDRLQLTDTPDFITYKIEGLNPPQATINSTANTTIDGSDVNSVRLESRNIVIYTAIRGDIERNRIKLYKHFPSKGVVTLYFKNSSRDVNISGVVESVVVDQFQNPQIAQISIFCGNPYFKDEKPLEISLSEIVPNFEFPFSIPEEGQPFSEYIVNYKKTIINPSDTDTSVTVTLYAAGEVINPTIYDLTHNKQMRLNLTLQDNDVVTINMHYDEKSIILTRNGKKTNALGYMRPDSKWFILSAGDNVFTYSCESGAENLNITFTAPILYSGV